MERDQEDNIRHELDNQFADLRELIFAPDPSSSGSNMVPLGIREGAPYPKPPTDAEAVVAKLIPTGEGDDYDQHVRELAFDKRAKPKDRTKTEEELALEAKEALEKAERKRRRRMLGLEESEDEEETGKGKAKRKRGGDDLDDDFDDPDEDLGILGAGLGSGIDPDDDESEEDDVSDERDEEDESEEDENYEVEGSDESEGEEGDHEQLVASHKPAKSKSKGKNKGKQELPFTFPCPTSHEEFLEIVEDLDDDDVPIVVQRIRALYHTSLAADNKVKLQVRQCFRDQPYILLNYFFCHRHSQQYSSITSSTLPLLQNPDIP